MKANESNQNYYDYCVLLFTVENFHFANSLHLIEKIGLVTDEMNRSRLEIVFPSPLPPESPD